MMSPNCDSTRTTRPAPVHFPERFRGIFTRQRQTFGPLLAEAREVLEAHPVPDVVRFHYEYVVLAPQPSFMLLPLMYLELAAKFGPVGERHRNYLPWVMLAMELSAVLDDTVDQTPCRSDRDTYPRRFGPCSSAPFCCLLLNTLISKTLETAPEVLPLVSEMFQTLCALEIWEFEKCYPALDPADCQRWLQSHYAEVTPAIAYGLNSALLIGSQQPLPGEVCTLFAEIMQDVDDLVNVAEHREGAGENNDFKMGIVTYPLVAALDGAPGLRGVAEAVWRPHRAARLTGGDPMIARGFIPDESTDVQTILQAMAAIGIPATLERIERNAAACISATPHYLRSTIGEFVGAFVERARHASTYQQNRQERPLALA